MKLGKDDRIPAHLEGKAVATREHRADDQQAKALWLR
jgi:hypothetical protein